MEAALIVSILLYLLSAAGYLAYFFLQKKHLQKAGFIVLVGGFIFHSAALVLHYLQQGHIPVANMRETLSLAGWAIAGVFILLNYRYNLKILGVYAAPFVALIMVIVSQLPDEPAKTTQLFKSVWLVAHVTVIFVGEAAFALACGAGILYLIQENSIKTKKWRFFFKRLPSLDLLDSTGYGCIVVGFTMLTIGLITGLVYAKSVWGRFWSWDPKEVWSGLAWLFYAALLHERLAVGWRGRRSAIMAIVGFGVLVFTFLGVNLLMEGHHKEFTK
jgi:cytochrome c-type biogenesis protein CcsB